MKSIIKIIKEEIHLMETREQFIRLFHGTSIQGAEDIIKNGIDIQKSEGGYFGKGFYTTPDINLAKSNYADFADDEGGAILEFELSPEANILDLRDSDDWDTYLPFAQSREIFKPSHPQAMLRAGIDGLYDNSFEGVVIYNPKSLRFIKVHQL